MFDNMTEALFQENEDGTIVYYAKGLLRQGYIINETEKERLFKFHKKIFKYLLPLGIIYAMLLGLAGISIIGLLPIMIVAFIIHFKQKSLIKNLHAYHEKPTIEQAQKKLANIFPKPLIIFMMINGALAVIMALLLPFLADDNMKDIGFIVGLLLLMGIPLLGIGWYFYKNIEKK